MLIALQNILFCLLFISLVNPKEYIEEAHKRGLATIMYLVLAFAVAGLIVLIGKILVN